MEVTIEAWKNLAFDRDPLEHESTERRYRVVRAYGFGPVMAALEVEVETPPEAEAR